MEGNTARGASSPANPAFIIPDPLSNTTAADSSSSMMCSEVWWWCWFVWVNKKESEESL
jgi:hypothetical protein